jgi:archaellum biogenesis protein FlaJ (TadC family)
MGADVGDHGALSQSDQGAVMRRLKAFLARLSGSLNKERSEREMAAEIESHLKLHIDDIYPGPIRK